MLTFDTHLAWNKHNKKPKTLDQCVLIWKASEKIQYLSHKNQQLLLFSTLSDVLFLCYFLYNSGESNRFLSWFMDRKIHLQTNGLATTHKHNTRENHSKWIFPSVQMPANAQRINQYCITLCCIFGREREKKWIDSVALFRIHPISQCLVRIRIKYGNRRVETNTKIVT